jgi:hypothetical protein
VWLHLSGCILLKFTALYVFDSPPPSHHHPRKASALPDEVHWGESSSSTASSRDHTVSCGHAHTLCSTTSSPQVIAQPDERYEAYCRGCDFIREHIFPGGHLPSMGAMVEAARGTQVGACGTLAGIGLGVMQPQCLWHTGRYCIGFQQGQCCYEA